MFGFSAQATTAIEGNTLSEDEVERVADSLNRINLEYAKLNKRVLANEEWVGSVNAFRRQVNTTMGKLQTSVRALEARP